MVKTMQLLFYFFPVLIAFILPFGNALSSPLIALWFISSMFCIKDLFVNLKNNSFWFWSILSFFILTTFSNIIFFNAADPFNAIEIKLSFLFFPLLFFLFKADVNIAKRMIVAFVSGCLIASLFMVGRAFMYLLEGDSSYFYYSKFSYFMHSAYFAMYLNLALVFVAFYYFSWFKVQKAYFKFSYFLIGFFTLVIILCASKIGLITLFTLVPLVLVLKYKHLITGKHIALAGGLLLVISSSVYFFIPQVFDRLRSVTVVANANIDKSATESSSVRVLIWNECKEIISDHPITGVGVSHANESLYRAYEEHGLTGAFEKKLNAHNQYFQTFIGMGIFGFMNLLILTVGIIVYAIRKKRYLLMFFGALIAVNFLVESMLQTSAGNVFFVYFLCYLIIYDEEKLNHEVS